MEKRNITAMKEAANFGARMFKGFKDLQEAAQSIDDLSNFEADLSKKVESLKQERTDLEQAAAHAKLGLTEIKKEADQMVKDAEEAAKLALVDAKAEADSIVANARSVEREYAERLAAVKAEVKEFEEKAAQAKAELARLEKKKADFLASLGG